MRCLLVVPVSFFLLATSVHSQTDDKVSEDVELLEDVQSDPNTENEEYHRRRPSHHSFGHGHHSVIHPAPPVVRTRVTVQKRILRPIIRDHGVGHVIPRHGLDHGFEGSYVAVSGRPGERTIHAVNGRGSVAVEPGYGGVVHPRVAHVRPVYDYDYYDRGVSVDTLLPKCSYINTDFEGNDVGDGRGLTAGSPYACKKSCIDQDGCEFWTFRRGWARDCYLKRGDGDRSPNNVRRRPGFVSGSRSNDCVCLEDGGDEICPTRRRGGQAFPWNHRSSRPRFDYDDYDFDDIDDRDVEVATRNRDKDDDSDEDNDNNGRGRRNRNRNRNRNRSNRNRNRGGGDDDAEDLRK